MRYLAAIIPTLAAMPALAHETGGAHVHGESSAVPVVLALLIVAALAYRAFR